MQGLAHVYPWARLLYFFVLNASSEHYLSVRSTIDVKKIMILTFGQSCNIHDVPPCAQTILIIALSDGTDSAPASVAFSKVCDSIATSKTSRCTKGRDGIGNVVDLNVARDISVEVKTDATKFFRRRDCGNAPPLVGTSQVRHLRRNRFHLSETNHLSRTLSPIKAMGDGTIEMFRRSKSIISCWTLSTHPCRCNKWTD